MFRRFHLNNVYTFNFKEFTDFLLNKRKCDQVQKLVRPWPDRFRWACIEIRYKTGTDTLLTDGLSRSYLENHKPSSTEVEVGHIHAAQFLPVPDHRLKELQKETACDRTLQVLKTAILNRFPDSKEEKPVFIHQYFSIRDELSVVDGTVFKGLRARLHDEFPARAKISAWPRAEFRF